MVRRKFPNVYFVTVFSSVQKTRGLTIKRIDNGCTIFEFLLHQSGLFTTVVSITVGQLMFVSELLPNGTTKRWKIFLLVSFPHSRYSSFLSHTARKKEKRIKSLTFIVILSLFLYKIIIFIPIAKSYGRRHNNIIQV